MTNKHVKVINGRKYYYESIRKGKKVTSRYIGPVERIRKKKKTFSELEQIEAGVGMPVEQLVEEPRQEENEEGKPEDSYIG